MRLESICFGYQVDDTKNARYQASGTDVRSSASYQTNVSSKYCCLDYYYFFFFIIIVQLHLIETLLGGLTGNGISSVAAESRVSQEHEYICI